MRIARSHLMDNDSSALSARAAGLSSPQSEGRFSIADIALPGRASRGDSTCVSSTIVVA
jgi:hypothetical protein